MPAPATQQVPPPAPPPLFRTTRASNALLLGLKSDGPPERFYWDTGRLAASQSTGSLFRLTTATLPALEEKRRKKRDSQATLSPSQGSKDGDDDERSDDESAKRASAPSFDPEPVLEQKEPPRTRKYLDLLMKHHDKREDKWRKEKEAEETERRHMAAQLAKKRVLAAEAQRRRDDSDSDNSQKEEKIEGDFGALTAYEGQIKLDLEVVVMGAPKEKRRKKKKDRKPREPRYKEVVLPNGEIEYVLDTTYSPSASSSGSFYTASSSSSSGRSSSGKPFSSSSSSTAASTTRSSESTPRMDLAAELEALHEELGSDSSSSSGSDGLPDGMGEKKNPWDDPKMRWRLGIGGTVFFVPDAERYGHAPSLPPPPPKSLQGPGKVRIKPRLPLDISNHRYRDEHANVWATDPYNPTKVDKRAFEQKLLTLDFYTSCNKAMTRLPPLEREKDALKHEVAFGHSVESDTNCSFAWRIHLERESRRKQKEAERRAREAARAAGGAAAAAGEGSTELGEPSSLETLQDSTQQLEAGLSTLTIGSLGMPSESGGPGSRP